MSQEQNKNKFVYVCRRSPTNITSK